jgi:predicted oxidoreductase
MEKVQLSENLKLSRIVHGHWRLKDWNYTTSELLTLTKEIIDLGITSIDTADIYGDYACEGLFGNVLKADPSLRNKIEIINKCGISLVSDKFPNRKIKTYNYRYDYIIGAVERSLKNLNTDHIDLLLLHRPSPLTFPEEIAKAFDELEKTGKVLNFGVSNFLPDQFEMLQSYTDQKLVTNQVEISPLHLENFENGNIDFFLKERLRPMAWSPIARGRLFSPETEKEIRLSKTINEILDESNAETMDQIILAWLLHHPANIIPIIGTGNLERIKSTIGSLSVKLTDEQWLRIYISSIGEELP